MYKIQQLNDSDIIELSAGKKTRKKQKKRFKRWLRRWRNQCRNCDTGNDFQKVNVKNNGKGNHVITRNRVGYHEVW